MGKRNKRKKYRTKSLVASSAVAAVNDFAKANVATDFGVVIPDQIFKKVMYWIDKASPNEVSGFGSLEFDNGMFTVNDVTLLTQVVSGGETEMDPNAINKAMFEMRAKPNALKWHWHSHPTFGVFWSGTDMNLIRELGQQGWILASVINCKREIRSAFLTTVDVMGMPHDIFVDDIATAVHSQVSTEERRTLDREFDAKVSTRVYRAPVAARQRYPAKNWEEHFAEDVYCGQATQKTVPPVPQFIADSRYDKFGFAEVDGVEIYNPLKDRELLTEDDRFFMLSDMKEEEIDFLKKCDAGFSDLVRRYIVAQATKVDAIASEASWQKERA